MMMTVQDEVRANLTSLTAGQVKLANALLADYPFAGLQPIQKLADATGVSPPSISRFVNRLGFAGFGDFQHALIEELREGSRSPRDLRALSGEGAGACFLKSYTQRAAELVRQLPQTITQQQLDSVAALLGDPARNIYVRGGRISDTLARFLSLHLRQTRPGIHHLADDPELWPDAVLRMRRRDVAVLFDFRRYQPSLERLAAAISEERRAQVVLITDKWQSPAALLQPCRCPAHRDRHRLGHRRRGAGPYRGARRHRVRTGLASHRRTPQGLGRPARPARRSEHPEK